jgi:citrate synthase
MSEVQRDGEAYPPAARLSTRQVADRLGVKPETVYAYVSRGLLRSHREPGGRGSWFDPKEVEELSGHTRQAAANGGTSAEPFIATELTLLSDGGLYYRGRDVTELAGTASFEAVAGLLWTGRLEPVTFEASPQTLDLARQVARAMPDSARLPDLLHIVPSIAAVADPLRFDLHPDSVRAASAGLLAVMIESLPDRSSGSGSGSGSPSQPTSSLASSSP